LILASELCRYLKELPQRAITIEGIVRRRH
jgi:hypothetical protein